MIQRKDCDRVVQRAIMEGWKLPAVTARGSGNHCAPGTKGPPIASRKTREPRTRRTDSVYSAVAPQATCSGSPIAGR